MLINNNYKYNKHVKFVSYKADNYALCSGKLVLNIDGINVSFGVGQKCEYTKFWNSGGSCGFKNGYENSYINKGEWVIDINKLPASYQPYAIEIDRVFNDNVPYGCCGGCL